MYVCVRTLCPHLIINRSEVGGVGARPARCMYVSEQDAPLARCMYECPPPPTTLKVHCDFQYPKIWTFTFNSGPSHCSESRNPASDFIPGARQPPESKEMECRFLVPVRGNFPNQKYWDSIIKSRCTATSKTSILKSQNVIPGLSEFWNCGSELH